MNLPTIIEQSGQRVLTTAQLAESYGTTTELIKRNFSNNKSRYSEGKHYYYLTGEELKQFKNEVKNLPLVGNNEVRNSDLVGKNTSQLYLWTERGALLHAKSLNTDKAWEVYDFLIENYFRARTKPGQPEISSLSPMLQYLIQMEQKQNQLEQRQNDLEKRIETSLDYDRDELIKTVLSLERIGSHQRQNIVKAVRKRAFDICNYAETYEKIGKRVISNIYTALQKEFEVDSYLDLVHNQYTDAIIFIECWMPDKNLELAIMRAYPKPDTRFLNMLWSDPLKNDSDQNPEN